MPVARKLLICAAVDGLLIQPLSTKGHNRSSSNPIKLRYGGEAWITAASRDDLAGVSSFEAFGIVGLFSVSKQLQFLISITRRQQVAQIRGFPVYVVTEVAITPCCSREAAEKSVAKTAAHLKKQREDESSGESDDESWEQVNVPADAVDDVDDLLAEEAIAPGGRGNGSPGGTSSPVTSIAEDVIRRRGSFGRFAQKWFSKDGWRQEQWRSMGMRDSGIESSAPPRSSLEGTSARKISLEEEDREVSAVSRLLPKLLRTTHILFGTSRSFYFSYDVDLTQRLGTDDKPSDPQKPLYVQVSPTYCWNHHLLKPFSNSIGEPVAIPLVQGFVGQKTFIMDSSPPQEDESGPESLEMSNFSLTKSEPVSPLSEPAKEEPVKSGAELRPSEKGFLITVISRRSRFRSGLRYLRRGIDDEGDVANAVETEQILSSPFWDRSTKIYSFVQIRGSIPVFFTQTPLSFKPMPILQHSPEANLAAMRLHFQRLRSLYGNVQVVNLVERGNSEAVAGEAYERQVSKLNEEVGDKTQAVPFEWFDFHAVCRGMKFENVSRLLEKIKDTLDDFGSTVVADGEIVQQQKGVVRTNCMDCLDRTNVCQSMFAKYMLEAQLREEGFDMSAQRDQNYWWFNNVWADNGDAVSKQYASTAAMKGDFTRTRKRDYRGQLNDLGLSLTRFYNGSVSLF